MVTVADFTSDLEQIRCVAGFCGTNREVTSFTIIDTPEILDWLHGGEFVVDSGYITSHNPSMLKGFIASLKEKGCAALGVKLHRYHNEIPGIILDDGNKLDFPIYEMPYNLYFCDFASMIYKRIFEEQLDDMYHVSIAYKDIVNSFSKYKVPERMLSELSLVLRNPVFLINSQFELIEYSYGPSDDFSLQNTHYWRFKNIKVTYLLPKDWMKKSKIASNASVYLDLQNTLLLTNYEGLDPEMEQNASPLPIPFTVVLGVDITF